MLINLCNIELIFSKRIKTERNSFVRKTIGNAERRIELGAAGWEARTLPSAMPPMHPSHCIMSCLWRFLLKLTHGHLEWVQVLAEIKFTLKWHTMIFVILLKVASVQLHLFWGTLIQDASLTELQQPRHLLCHDGFYNFVCVSLKWEDKWVPLRLV